MPPTTTSQRSTLDLMHIASGRTDLSRNPVDHDEWCAKTIDAEAICTCTRSPHFQEDGGR